MDKENGKENEYGCSSHMMHHGCGRHFVLRLVLGLIILSAIFWGGFKLGELKAILSGESRGYYMMQRNGAVQTPYSWGPGMMGQY